MPQAHFPSFSCNDCGAPSIRIDGPFTDVAIVRCDGCGVEPMRSFVQRMQALENNDGILSVSFGHGFPWGDVADVGAKVLVVADGDHARASSLARQLGQEIWALRHETTVRHDTIDEAIDAALAAPESFDVGCIVGSCCDGSGVPASAS